jgi:hypothetical protein
MDSKLSATIKCGFYTADYKGFQKFNMPLLTGGKYLQGFITFFTALAFRLKRD